MLSFLIGFLLIQIAYSLTFQYPANQLVVWNSKNNFNFFDFTLMPEFVYPYPPAAVTINFNVVSNVTSSFYLTNCVNTYTFMASGTNYNVSWTYTTANKCFSVTTTMSNQYGSVLATQYV